MGLAWGTGPYTASGRLKISGHEGGRIHYVHFAARVRTPASARSVGEKEGSRMRARSRISCRRPAQGRRPTPRRPAPPRRQSGSYRGVDCDGSGGVRAHSASGGFPKGKCINGFTFLAVLSFPAKRRRNRFRRLPSVSPTSFQRLPSVFPTLQVLGALYAELARVEVGTELVHTHVLMSQSGARLPRRGSSVAMDSPECDQVRVHRNGDAVH
eukprot:gene16850-biopygen2905